MKYETQPKEDGWKIRDVLKRRMGFSTRLIRKLKEEGGVFLDGEERWLNVPVRPGQVIEVNFPEETSWFEPQDIPLEILMEDEDLLILNKRPGIVVHPTKGHADGTIANALAYYMKQKGENWKIRFVNRLDMDTSGLLIVARNAFSQEKLQQQMKNGGIVKKYLAVVDGILEEEEGVIDLPIGLIGENEVGRCVRADGYPSITKYKRINILKGERTLVELTLETGRTHQIRVHMAHIGHPVTGDSLYGTARPEVIGRQALHAWFLSFDHPTQNTRVEITAEMPEDMKVLCVTE